MNVRRRPDHGGLRLSPRLAVQLRPEISVREVCRAHNLTVERVYDDTPPTYILRAASPELTAALDVANALYEGEMAEFATPLITHVAALQFTANDPHWNDGSLWSLLNEGEEDWAPDAEPGNDIHVVPAWDDGWTGAGVRIAVVDAGGAV